MARRLILTGLSLLCLSASPSGGASAAPQNNAAVIFQRLHSLRGGETVFAYARISPSGRYLAYASEARDLVAHRITQTETVLDLFTGRTVFNEPGIDAYWSPDGDSFIFLSIDRDKYDVALRHMDGRTAHAVAPVSLGDYFSWAFRDRTNFILTINSNYYFLDRDVARLPAGRVTSCPEIGTGERPLISKDGRRITAFVRGDVVVRNVDDCRDMLDTGFRGAKADFSYDGRYVAFHKPLPNGPGSEIVIVDTLQKTFRTLTGLPGSAVFPSFTKNGDLCFRYDGPDYRGFMMAKNLASLPSRPLPRVAARKEGPVRWSDLFADPYAHKTELVMLWSDWSAHAPQALVDLQQFSIDRAKYAAYDDDFGVVTAVPPGPSRDIVDDVLAAHAIHLPELRLLPKRFVPLPADNQIPAELLFVDGLLVAQHLGPLSYQGLGEWVRGSLPSDQPFMRQ